MRFSIFFIHRSERDHAAERVKVIQVMFLPYLSYSIKEKKV